MKTQVRLLFALIVFFLLTAVILNAQEDIKGSKDYPLFSRWPGYYIADYNYRKFDAFTYQIEKGSETVEGEFYHLSYYAKQGVEAASELEVIRNYENTIRKAGGTVLYTYGKQYTVGRIVKEGKEIWIKASWANYGSVIYLDIIERKVMEQTIQANAASWFSDISTTGHAAVYGIYFDTDKAEIKAESKTSIEEMAKLLKTNATLNVFIVGHTDNIGAFDHNMKLSQDRAAAVVNALVKTHGIASTRLKGAGVGPLSPIASNDTEEGKAKNRRVELVKQ